MAREANAKIDNTVYKTEYKAVQEGPGEQRDKLELVVLSANITDFKTVVTMLPKP